MKRPEWQPSTATDMDQRDIEIRNQTYDLFVTLGRAPEPAEVAHAAAGLAVEDVRQSWRQLHQAHALTLDEATGGIRMANPFSAVPTPYRVEAAGRWWFANCAWDAFGICAALHADGTIETSCPDCGDALSVSVRDRHPGDPTLLFHCLVPAARWWADIGFT